LVDSNFTRIPNRLLDAIIQWAIPPRELVIFLLLLRETRGFNRNAVSFSLARIEQKTGIDRSHVSRAIKNLGAAKMIEIEPSKGRVSSQFRPCLDPSGWDPLWLPHKQQSSGKEPLPQEQQMVAPQATDGCPTGNSIPSSLNKPFKETLIKKPSSCSTSPKKEKDGRPNGEISTDAFELAMELRDSILSYHPGFKAPGENGLERWARTTDRMIRIDHRTPGEISRIITWVAKDEFWSGNILSMEKLRKQFDRLILKIKRGGDNEKPETKKEYPKSWKRTGN